MPPVTQKKLSMGGGVRCSVAGCRSSYKNSVGSAVSFHSVPKDPLKRKVWLSFCKKDTNPASCRICSKHFSEKQFSIDMEARIMGYNRRKRLKSTAIPDINLGKRIYSRKSKGSLSKVEKSSPNKSTLKKDSGSPQETLQRSCKNVADSLISDNNDIKDEVDSSSEEPLDKNVCTTCENVGIVDIIIERDKLKEEIISVTAKLREAEKQVTKLQSAHEVALAKLSEKEASIAVLKKLNTDLCCTISTIKSLFSPVISDISKNLKK